MSQTLSEAWECSIATRSSVGSATSGGEAGEGELLVKQTQCQVCSSLKQTVLQAAARAVASAARLGPD